MMFTRRWKDKIESIFDAFWGLNRRVEALEYGKPDYRITLRIDEEAKRTTELEERISIQEATISRLMNAMLYEKLTPDTARDFFAIEKILHKDKDDLAGRKHAEREFNRVARIIDGAKGKN